MLSTWLFTLIIVGAGFLLYKYGYYRGYLSSKELLDEIKKAQSDG